MKRQTAAQTKKEITTLPVRGLAQHTAVRAVPEHELAPNVSLETRFGHDFSQATVRPSAPMVGQNYATAACPVFPRRCPFGGACHICPARVQTKLAINEPGDKYERKADRVAGQVMRMPEPQAARNTQVSQGTQASKINLQRRATNQAVPATLPPIVHDVLHSPGQPLDPATRAFMEPRFGHDFSRVRVHTDTKAAESARAVNALAYTIGWNTVFGAGEYAPETTAGRRLLAHELVHTIQQRKSGNERTLQEIQMGRSSDAYERFAELMARQASERDAVEGTKAGMNRTLAINTSFGIRASTNGLLLQRTCAANSDEEFYKTSPDYCKDTGFTGLLHPGQQCYREVPRRSSYLQCPPGDQVCFDDQGRCHDSPDKVSPVEKKNPDDTCNLHFVCSLGHYAVDVSRAGKVRTQIECIERCKELPWYLGGFCFQQCSLFPEPL